MKKRYTLKDLPALYELSAICQMMQNVLAKAKGPKLNSEELKEMDRIGELLKAARAKYRRMQK